MQPLSQILHRVYPLFNLDLKDPIITINRNPICGLEKKYRGAVDYINKPDLSDKSETKFLDGVIFRIPQELTDDRSFARAYFAHECSHLELLKKPYHVAYFKALSKAVWAMRPFHKAARQEASTRSEITRMITGVAQCVPLVVYVNLVERIVDRNARNKGFGPDIRVLRAKYPLKVFHYDLRGKSKYTS